MNGIHTLAQPTIKRLGVKAFKSLRSSIDGVIRQAFVVCSTKHIVDVNTSSVTDRLPRMASIAFLQLFTNLSQVPPKCGATRRLHFQTMYF